MTAAVIACGLLFAGATNTQAQDIETIKWERQIAYLMTLVDSEPSVPNHYLRLAQAYAQLDREEMVIRYTQQAVERGGSPLAARILVGDFQADRGRYERALSEYQAVLRASPMQSYTLTKVWMILQRSRMDEIGLNIDTRILETTLKNAGFFVSNQPPAKNPAAAVARLKQGNRMLNNGDATGAISAYKDAAGQDPWNPDIYRGLGIAYARSGDKFRAVGSYQLYLAMAPPDRPDLPKVRQIIIDFFVTSTDR